MADVPSLGEALFEVRIRGLLVARLHHPEPFRPQVPVGCAPKELSATVWTLATWPQCAFTSPAPPEAGIPQQNGQDYPAVSRAAATLGVGRAKESLSLTIWRFPSPSSIAIATSPPTP